MSWVPYVCNIDKWRHHFKLVGEGKVPPQGKWYRVGSVNQRGQGSDPVVKMINPTQQVVDRAKQELKRADTESIFPDATIKGSCKKKPAQSTTKTARGRTGKATEAKANQSKSKNKPVKKVGTKRNQTWIHSV